MRLDWSVFAMEDREAIFDYICSDSPKAAIAVDDRIEQQAEALTEFPGIGRTGCVDGTRELVIQPTPYIVVYAVETKRILVLRVLHGSQRWPEQF